MASQDVTHFPSVDYTADSGLFLYFLDEANKQPGVAAWKSLMLDGLRLQPGMQVLDAGYGIGTDAFELAGLVNPGGAVTVFGEVRSRQRTGCQRFRRVRVTSRLAAVPGSGTETASCGYWALSVSAGLTAAARDAGK